MLDFQLRHMQEAAPPEERVRVLVLYRNDLAELEKIEFKVSSVAGDVAVRLYPGFEIGRASTSIPTPSLSRLREP